MEEPGFGWSLKEDGTEGFQPTTVQLTVFNFTVVQKCCAFRRTLVLQSSNFYLFLGSNLWQQATLLVSHAVTRVNNQYMYGRLYPETILFFTFNTVLNKLHEIFNNFIIK